MNHSTASWERVLANATEKAEKSVSVVAASGNRALSIGTGASGDKTLLADLRAEQELTKALLRVDGVRILSEEGGDIGDPKNRTLGVIDPLDGSSNFELDLPFYCTSVAIASGESLREVRVAMVRNLVNGDTYFAAKGKGASKNGKKICTGKRGKLREAVLDIDLGGASEEAIKRLVPLLSRVKRVVHYGANALELCLLAEGSIDAFVDLRGKMRATDIAGGYLIAKEAGATISLTREPRSSPELCLTTRFGLVATANHNIQREISLGIQARRGTI